MQHSIGIETLAELEKAWHMIKSERVLTVRYEDLVQDPEETLQGICTFLGEDFDNRMLVVCGN